MKVSILIITYNHEKYILDAVDSILMQKTSFEKEIILLDDSSTDGTFELASSRLRDINNTVLVKNESNLGITKNYQKGFSLCEGEYVFVLEGDDYWIDTQKVQKQVEFLVAHPFHVMCFHPFVIQQGKTSVFQPFILSGNSELGSPPGLNANASRWQSFGINDLIAVEGLIGTFSVCCYRKKWLNQLPAELFNVVAYDWAVNLFMGHFGLLGRINEVMAVYRMSEEATWSKKTYIQQAAEICTLIPVYDALLGHQYVSLFQQKLQSIQTNLNNSTVQSDGPTKWGSTVIPKLLRRMLPQTLWKR